MSATERSTCNKYVKTVKAFALNWYVSHMNINNVNVWCYINNKCQKWTI